MAVSPAQCLGISGLQTPRFVYCLRLPCAQRITALRSIRSPHASSNRITESPNHGSIRAVSRRPAKPPRPSSDSPTPSTSHFTHLFPGSDLPERQAHLSPDDNWRLHIGPSYPFREEIVTSALILLPTNGKFWNGAMDQGLV